VFGWAFYAVLLGFLGVATYTDIGRLKIPNKLTVTMLAVGLVVSLVRGAWLGSVLEQAGSDQTVWLFANTPVLGALDGLLCALAGFAASFVVFMLLWLLGVLGGGDVKLMAALGAWVGFTIQMVFLVLGSMIALILLGVVLMVRKLFRRGVQKTVFNVKQGAQAGNLRKTRAGMKRRDQVLALSLPVAIATGLLLPFFIQHNSLHRPVPQKTPPSEQASVQR
jgi:Flp pilus assembly protein protease CpaA